MKGAHYVMQIEYDPSDTYPRGARFPLGEFLAGVREGIFPHGMRVSKRAETSEFTVRVNKYDNNYLTDTNNGRWSVRKYGNGFQMKYVTPTNKRKG